MTTILLVEDDTYLRTSLAKSLERHGYVVTHAESVDEATTLLRQQDFDVLVTDLDLLGASGLDLLRLIRDLELPIRSVVMSGYASARDYQRAIGLGAVRVLCKPFSSQDLVGAIEQALETRNSFYGSIHGLGIIDLMQMYHLARRDIVVHVHGSAHGRVYMKGGEIVHAILGTQVGPDALCAVLGLEGGSLSTEIISSPVPRTIEGPFNQILLDSLRMLDEAKLAAGSESETVLWDADDDSVVPGQRACS